MTSLRHRATLLICGLIFAVIVAFGAAAYAETRELALGAASERLLSASSHLAANLGASATRIREDLSTVADDPALAGFLRASAGGANDEALLALSRGDTAGPVLVTELRDVSGRRLLSTVSRSPVIEQELAGDVAVLADASRGEARVGAFRTIGDTVVYPAIAPIDVDGAVAGYVVRWRQLSTGDESRSLILQLIGSDASVYLSNIAGDVWTDLRNPIEPRTERSVPVGVVTPTRTVDGDALIAAAAVAGTPWLVSAEAPTELILAGTQRAIQWLLLTGLVLLLFGAAVAWWVTGRLTLSIGELADAAGAITAGDYSRRTSVEGDDEVGRLGAAFNTMANSVASAHRLLERKVAELASSEARNRRTREQLEHVTASSGAILYTYRLEDGDPRLDWISDNVESLVGYPVEDALADGWWAAGIHSDDVASVRASRTRLGTENYAVQEYRFLHAEGRYRWVRDEQRVLRNQRRGKSEVVGTISDISEHRHLEVAKATAEAANRAKSDFLSRMSHELRTPLNAILGFGQLLKLDATLQSDQESVEQIIRAGDHLLAMINEVLDIARVESGQLSISVEPVSVGAVLQDSLDLVRLTAAEQGITLRAPNGLRGEQYVRADQQRLKQVLLNLLSNAIKYNQRGGVVTLSCEDAEDGRVRIRVEDNGFGIPEAKLAQLFMPFERLGAEQTSVEGTGLGLALSKGLVEAMDGSIGVESVEGEGSRFWIELPRSLPPEPSAPAAATHVEQPTAPQADTSVQFCVLFIEDNLANVRLMERVFMRRPNVRLLTAMQGSLGLDLAREHRPDMVLLDVNLPDMSGEKVLLQLRQDPELRSTPVVMISGDAIPSRVERVLELGARAYITKPFNIQDLLTVVDETLDENSRRVTRQGATTTS